MFSGHGFFNSQELSMLEDLFYELCASTDINPSSLAATKLAKELMAAFEHGIRERDTLLSVVVTGELSRDRVRGGTLVH